MENLSTKATNVRYNSSDIGKKTERIGVTLLAIILHSYWLHNEQSHCQWF